MISRLGKKGLCTMPFKLFFNISLDRQHQQKNLKVKQEFLLDVMSCLVISLILEPIDRCLYKIFNFMYY